VQRTASSEPSVILLAAYFLKSSQPGSWGRAIDVLFDCREVALSMILLAGAGLLIKDLLLALRVPTGLETENVLTFQLDAPSSKYNSAQVRISLYRDLRIV
jgi:hypothetical protein